MVLYKVWTKLVLETIQKNREMGEKRSREKRITEKAQLANIQNKMIIITIDTLGTKRTF